MPVDRKTEPLNDALIKLPQTGSFILLSSDFMKPALESAAASIVHYQHSPGYDLWLTKPWMVGSTPTSAAATLTSRDYVISLERIEALRHESDEDDRPTDYSYRMSLDLLKEVATDLKTEFSRAIAAVGPGRGLRVTWSLGTRQVRLICGGSPSNKTYIYIESNSEHNVDYQVTGSRLATYLRWLSAGI